MNNTFFYPDGDTAISVSSNYKICEKFLKRCSFLMQSFAMPYFFFEMKLLGKDEVKGNFH